MLIDPPSSNVILSQDTPEAAMEKPLRITGSPESVETAKQLVTEVLANIDDRDSFGGRGRGRSVQYGYTVYWFLKQLVHQSKPC